jgi:hypothetical protein
MKIWPYKRDGLFSGGQFSSILLSEIWPYKRDGLSSGGQFSSILLLVHLKSGLKRELVFGSNDLVREGLLDMYI